MEDSTFPPSDFIESAISFLGRLSVPVIQNVFPSNFPEFKVSFSSDIS